MARVDISQIIRKYRQFGGSSSVRRPVRHRESEIQQSCVEWFRYTYPRYVIAAVPNGGRRDAKEAFFMRMDGVLAGFSDLIIIAERKVLFVEMKAGRNKQQPSQMDFQRKVEGLGHKYVVCYSLDDFMKGVKEWLESGR